MDEQQQAGVSSTEGIWRSLRSESVTMSVRIIIIKKRKLKLFGPIDLMHYSVRYALIRLVCIY